MMLTELLVTPLQLADAAAIHPAFAGGGGPVDLDITAFIYLALFLVSWFALKALIFDPWLKVRDARASGTEGNRAEADAMQATADAKLAEYTAALAGARTDASTMRAELKTDADKKEADIVSAARAASMDKLAAHREAVQAQVDGARGELAAEAERLGTAMAKTLLPG
jgi:F-type H+-transporting ATPase subunit b